MYTKQKNPIAIRSQQMISEGMIRLMKRISYQKITVSDLCEESAVGRKTFYRNFESKEDVIDFQLDQLLREYEEEQNPIPLEKKLHFHFSFLEKHMEYLTLLYFNGLMPMMYAKFNFLIPQIMPIWSQNPVEQRYRSACIVSMINAVVYVWAEREFEESVDEITKIMKQSLECCVPMGWVP